MKDKSPSIISRDPSKTISAELLYTSRLTLHSRHALMTFFAPEYMISTRVSIRNRIYNYKARISNEREKNHQKGGGGGDPLP